MNNPKLLIAAKPITEKGQSCQWFNIWEYNSSSALLSSIRGWARDVAGNRTGDFYQIAFTGYDTFVSLGDVMERNNFDNELIDQIISQRPEGWISEAVRHRQEQVHKARIMEIENSQVPPKPLNTWMWIHRILSAVLLVCIVWPVWLGVSVMMFLFDLTNSFVYIAYHNYYNIDFGDIQVSGIKATMIKISLIIGHVVKRFVMNLRNIATTRF